MNDTDPKTDEEPTASARDVERLADLFDRWERGEDGANETDAWQNRLARALLASDWLADVRREERERAWDEGRASLMEDAANYCSRSGLACLVDYPDVNPYRVREARGGAR